jgi:class 3 adenylate cyclase/DNA-binding beta-propeller fold protein YncE
MLRGRVAADRTLLTVLFTDIARSTEHAAELGDQAWRRLLARHHALVRRELRRHGGREVDTAGDGFFATFPQPAQAIRCARAIVVGMRALGLEVRAGIHTGEVERSGEKVGGIAAHIGARILAHAAPGEIVVSSTVRDLVVGSDLAFSDRGTQTLKGVPQEWRLFAVALPDAEVAVGDARAAAAEVPRWIPIPADRRRLLLGAAATIMVGVVALAGIVAFTRPAPPIATGPDTVVAFSRTTGEPILGVPVGAGPAGLAVGEGAVWVTSLDRGTVTRIDASSGESQVFGQVGARPAAVVVDSGAVWVADPFADTLSIVDAASGALLHRFDDVHASALLAAFGSIWASDDVHDQVWRFDATTRERTSSVALPAGSGASGLAAAADRVWVALSLGGSVVPLDPASGSIGDAVPFGDPTSMAAGADLWATSHLTDRVARIDPRGGRIMATITVGDTPTALGVSEDGVWIACTIERSVWRLDSSGAERGRIPLGGQPTAIALDADRVWVAIRGDQ